MLMIKCPECGKAVSDQDKECPRCGYAEPEQPKNPSDEPKRGSLEELISAPAESINNITIKHFLAAIVFGQLLIFAGLIFVGVQISDLDSTVYKAVWEMGVDIVKILEWISNK